MALKKDKEKVIDPVWSEDRVRAFLDIDPPAGENADFHRLLKAYQSMRDSDFALFVQFFKDSGGDIDAKNQQGQTVAQIIAQHKLGAPYLNALKQ